MHRLILRRKGNNTYEIIEYNDERLHMIGLILVNPKVREYIKSKLNHLTDVLVDEVMTINNTKETLAFRFRQINEQKLYINLEIKGENGLKETDIKNDALRSIIDTFEDFKNKSTNEIEITRYQDTFLLNSIP